MDALEDTRDQRTFEAVDLTGQKCSKEVVDRPIGQRHDAIVFWNSLGVVYVDWRKKCEKLTGLYWPNYWADWMQNCIITVLFGEEKMFLLHENEQAHTFALVTTKLLDLGY